MTGLAERNCVPCRGGVPPLDAAAIAPLQAQLDGWTLWSPTRRIPSEKPLPRCEAYALRTSRRRSIS